MTRKQQNDRYDLNQLRTEPWTPNQYERQVIKMSWTIASKACGSHSRQVVQVRGTSISFSAVAAYLAIIIYSSGKCVFFDLRAKDSWDCALLLLCCFGARRPYVIVAANLPVQRGLWVYPALTNDTAVAVVVIIPVQR